MDTVLRCCETTSTKGILSRQNPFHQELTEEKYRELYERTGFDRVRIAPIATEAGVIEGVRSGLGCQLIFMRVIVGDDLLLNIWWCLLVMTINHGERSRSGRDAFQVGRIILQFAHRCGSIDSAGM